MRGAGWSASTNMMSPRRAIESARESARPSLFVCMIAAGNFIQRGATFERRGARRFLFH